MHLLNQLKRKHQQHYAVRLHDNRNPDALLAGMYANHSSILEDSLGKYLES